MKRNLSSLFWEGVGRALIMLCIDLILASLFMVQIFDATLPGSGKTIELTFLRREKVVLCALCLMSTVNVKIEYLTLNQRYIHILTHGGVYTVVHLALYVIIVTSRRKILPIKGFTREDIALASAISYNSILTCISLLGRTSREFYPISVSLKPSVLDLSSIVVSLVPLALLMFSKMVRKHGERKSKSKV